MINISITPEQLISVFQQLPKKQKREILNDLFIEEWAGTPEALKLKKEREQQVKEGKTMTAKELKEKIKNRGY
jgi:hypothetical protein